MKKRLKISIPLDSLSCQFRCDLGGTCQLNLSEFLMEPFLGFWWYESGVNKDSARVDLHALNKNTRVFCMLFYTGMQLGKGPEVGCLWPGFFSFVPFHFGV